MPVFYLPETLRTWPAPRKLNGAYQDAREKSGAWLESFNAFSPRKQNTFNRCDFSLLASLAYPEASAYNLRTACDLMQLFFVFDEYTDVADPSEVQKMADITVDAFTSCESARPAGEVILGEISRQFWIRMVQRATVQSQTRFLTSWKTYIASVVSQATYRSDGHVPSIQEYFDMRRDNIGAWPSFALLELDLEIPNEAINHPAIQLLSVDAIDMLILGNDMCSYNVEQARDDAGCNIITTVMHSLSVDLPQALKWVSDHHDTLASRYLATKDFIPSWGMSIDADIAQYVDGLTNWVRANDCWSFESERYFGKAGKIVQETRVVALLPMCTGL